MDMLHARSVSISPIILATLLIAVLGSWCTAAAQSPLRAPAPRDLRLVADSKAPLTAQQLGKIQKFIDEKHRDAVIDTEVARFLGLGKDGKPVVAQQVSLVDKNKKTRHLFDRLHDGSGYLVGKRSADGMTVYRVDNDLTWIASVMWRKDGNKVALRSTDTEKALREELALWAGFADQQK